MSSFLESTASLERSKVKQLIIDCPEQTNKFIGLFNPIQMNFLLEQGFLPSATIWEKVIEWSGREKHPTGIGADFIDGTDAKFASVHKLQAKGNKSGIRYRAVITGASKESDLLIAVYNRWLNNIDYFQIPQRFINSPRITIEYNQYTKEFCSNKWKPFKVNLNQILLK